MLILQQDKKSGHRIFQLMYFVKYFMHKVPNKCSPVKSIWACDAIIISQTTFYWAHEDLLGSIVCASSRKQVEVISVSRLTHSDCSFISFPPELKCSRDHPHPSCSRYRICLLFTDLSKRLRTRMVLRAGDTLMWPELQPSALRDTRHHPTPVGKSRGLDGAQGAPAMLQPRQNTKKPTTKDVFQENGWLCGCLCGNVVSKLTSYQECLSSSPRFWRSVQTCMSLCGFPPTVLKTCTLGDSLLGGNVCPATNWTTFIWTSQYI